MNWFSSFSKSPSILKTLYLGAFASLILFSTAHPQSTARTDSIHIVTPAWENVTNKNGTGLYFDIIREVYLPVGVALDYQIVPWKRAMNMLKYHEADALPGGFYMSSDEVEDIFPIYPIGREILCAVSKKGKSGKWKGQASLYGKRVVWIRDYNYHKYLDGDVTWWEIDRARQGWKLVDKARADFYLDNYNMVDKYIKDRHIDRDRYDIQEVASRGLFLRFANTGKSRKLIKIYDSRMPVLIESGQIKRLFEKWGFPYPSLAPRPGN